VAARPVGRESGAAPGQIPGGSDPGGRPSSVVSEPCSWKLWIIGTPFGRLGMRPTLWPRACCPAN